MYSRRVSRWLASLVVLAAACSSSEVSRIEIAALSLEVAALVIADTDGRPLRVAGLLRPGQYPPAAELEDGERAFVVGTTHAAVVRAEPLLARAPLDGFALEVAPPPPRAQLSPEGAARRARFALPGDAVVLDADLSPAPRALADGLTASLRIPPDDPGRLALHPFGERGALLALGTTLPGELEVRANAALIRAAAPLSDDRVLILTERFLAVVERDGPFPRVAIPDRPAPFLHANMLSREVEEILLRDLVLEPGGTRAWVVGELRDDIGRIWTVDVSDEGIRATGTATLTPHASWPVYPELLAVTVDGRGSVIAGGSNAALLIKGPDAEVFEPRPRLLTLHREWVTRDTGYVSDITDIVASGDREHPHLLGTESARLLAGNAERDEWDLAVDASVYQQSLVEPHITSVAVDPATGETWVTTRGGGMARQARTGAPWEEVQVAVPPSLEPCATQRDDGAGSRFTLPILQSVWLDATHAYVAVRSCTSVLRVRRDDGSSSAIHRTGEARAQRTEDTDFTTIVRGGRGPLAVGGTTSIYEIRE